MLIPISRGFAEVTTLAFAVVVQGLGTHHICPANPLLASAPPVCANTNHHDHRDHSPPSSWDGPLDCHGEFCVYSNQAVSKHPWVILCTTRDAAQGLADYFDLVPNHLPLSEPPPYHVAEIPGKGRGLVANRTIYKGEHVTAEDAILALPIHAHQELPVEKRRDMYEMVLANLPSEARVEFLSQAGDDLITVIDRNGFEIHTGRDDDAVRYVGIFPEQALINHDCRPNLAYHFRGMTHITTAVRDIAPGEELSLSYIEATLPIRKRRAHLNELWKFTCTCAQCQLPSAEADASDARLRRIKLLQWNLDHPAKSFASGDLTPQTGTELVALYEHERLDVYIGYAYGRAAINYALFADEQNAKSFAEKAYNALEWQGGAEQKDLENLRGLLADPKAHWSWARLAGRHR